MSHDHDMPMNPPMDMNMSSSSMDMVMHMSFYWGKNAIILFPDWPNHSLGMYILAFFFVLFLALGIELFAGFLAANSKLSSSNPTVVAFVQATVYAVKMGFAYLVMVAVMSFNLGIFIAAVVGHAIGFFIVKARNLAVANQQDVNGNSVPKV
ncbi:copper transporter 6-like [Mercurialis annua]|uniref:copper transporter 6-like n=1 Tax=Mercurialis annua TaxID=3986 RepID=UPI00215F677A|nr:copper transporter 6-like [Mercurialis annua]